MPPNNEETIREPPAKKNGVKPKAIALNAYMLEHMRFRDSGVYGTEKVSGKATYKLKRVVEGPGEDANLVENLLNAREAALVSNSKSSKTSDVDVDLLSSNFNFVSYPQEVGVILLISTLWTFAREQIMKLAQPQLVEVEVLVPVTDAVTLSEGNRVDIFLDINPLKRYRGAVTRVPYQSSVTEAGVLAYSVRATLVDDKTMPRIGLRGSARVHGPRTTLFYFLFHVRVKCKDMFKHWYRYLHYLSCVDFCFALNV